MPSSITHYVGSVGLLLRQLNQARTGRKRPSARAHVACRAAAVVRLGSWLPDHMSTGTLAAPHYSATTALIRRHRLAQIREPPSSFSFAALGAAGAGASSDFTHRVHAPCSSVHNERDTGPPARRRTCSHANTQCQRAGAWRYPRISTIAVVVPADRQASQQQYWVACAITAAQAQGSIARLHGSKNAGAYRPSATASSPRSSLPRAVGQEGDARSKRVQAPSDTFA